MLTDIVTGFSDDLQHASDGPPGLYPIIKFLDVFLNVHRCFETLYQAFFAHSSDPSRVYTRYAPLFIKDAPFYEHRGLNLDISRNQILPEDVMRTITGMALNKMNYLHLQDVIHSNFFKLKCVGDLACRNILVTQNEDETLQIKVAGEISSKFPILRFWNVEENRRLLQYQRGSCHPSQMVIQFSKADYYH